MNVAGHSKADMSQEYTLNDLEEQERAVRAFQERILLPSTVAKTDTNGAAFKIEQAKFLEAGEADIPEELRKLSTDSALSGGPERTRISDLYRVKVAL